MATIIPVDDAEDPRLAGFVGIRERDLVRGAGRFVAEGTVVLSMLASPLAAANGFAARSLLILENRLAGLSDLLARFGADIPVHVVSQSVMDKVAGFHLHRGVLALGERRTAPDLATILASLPEPALVVIAAGLSNHDNVGAIFRNAAALGADAVLLDGECCDPLYRKALRVSVGTVLTLPWVRQGEPAGLVAAVEQAGLSVWGLSPRGRHELSAIGGGRGVALMLGTEGAGLPEDLLARVKTARIRQRPGIDSLNVATAGAIAIHEIAGRLGKI